MRPPAGRPCAFHVCPQAPPPAAPPRQRHGGTGGGHRRGLPAALLPLGVGNSKNLQVLVPARAGLTLVSVPTQDKYFRLENINSPKILVKSVLDYDAVQKVSLVLHVQVRVWSGGAEAAAPLLLSAVKHLPGHLQRLRLQQALLHLRGLHHRARQGRGQPPAVVPALLQDQLGDGQTVREQRLQRQGEPHGEGGEGSTPGPGAEEGPPLRTFCCCSPAGRALGAGAGAAVRQGRGQEPE